MEKSPQIEQWMLARMLLEQWPDGMAELVEKYNNEYEHWTAIKHKRCPKSFTAKDLWFAMMADRMTHRQDVWQCYNVHFALTNQMQRLCHEFDMILGGGWGNDSIVQDSHKERYLLSSLMEEAISSSQMEGASTTRKVAKDMLRKKIVPRDRSQQMIHNNYQTIQFIVENKDKNLTEDLLMHIHRLMTEHTLENEEDAGRMRTNNDVVVENAITHEVVHTPPSCEQLPQFVDDLCAFFNSKEDAVFVHPVIKAIIVHYMVSYMHPFADGNGRTARALFYWYMLKRGYWLTEYLSISRVIYKSKAAYEKSFLYAEAEGNDIGYFITYNLRVLQLAFKELQNYLERKDLERRTAHSYMRWGNVNERQAEIIQMFCDNALDMVSVKDVEARFNISRNTAKTDVVGLVGMGILSEVHLNKKKSVYVLADDFEEKMSKNNEKSK